MAAGDAAGDQTKHHRRLRQETVANDAPDLYSLALLVEADGAQQGCTREQQALHAWIGGNRQNERL